MANWLSRLVPWRAKSGEGQYRPGPYLIDNGWLSATAGKYLNWWQLGYSVNALGESSAMVEACVSAYAQTVAMCPGDHWQKNPDGGRSRVTNSALTRIIRRPNDYQSMSDLLLNLTRSLYTKGESFGLVIRNNRQEITELHLMRQGFPYIGEDGSIFYSLNGNEIVQRRFDFSAPIPARDVLHVKLHTPRHPLKGESPILSTVLDRAMSDAALSQQISFHLNQARPSFLLETDQQLTREQTMELRERWNAQTQGENSGGTPILTWGLKARPITTSAVDAQIADLLKMTEQNVALAFRMPLQILGVGGTPFASTEALMSSWKASGLGFALNHIEEAFGLLFGLGGMPNEYLEFDTNALMRSSFKERMEGWSIATKSGLSINEFRNSEDYASVEFGDDPRVQQQVVPLSYGAQLQPPAPTASAPPDPPADPNAGKDGNADSISAVRAFRQSNARHLSLAA